MRFLTLCIILIPVILTGCKKDKSAFENKILYEYKNRWIFPDKYVKVTVPVAIEGKVPAEFYTVREMYQKTGEASNPTYEPISIKAVNLKQWRVVEERRKEMLDDMFIFFMVVAGVGFIALIAGLFCLYKGLELWDELVVGGGLCASFGLTSAWYVDSLPIICTILSVGTVAMAVYILIRRHKNGTKQKGKVEETKDALKEVVGTIEQIKANDSVDWGKIKESIQQSPKTRALVNILKPIVKAKLGLS
jgi:hypothetical protein